MVKNSQPFSTDHSGCVVIPLKHRYKVGDSEERKPFPVTIHFYNDELKFYAYVQISDFSPWDTTKTYK